MSIKYMTTVWQQSKHDGSALLLMLAIADNCNDAGWCFPGLDYLAEKTRMSRRQVIRLVQTLEESGELTVVRGKGRTNSNQYHINLEKGDNLSPFLQKGDIQGLKQEKKVTSRVRKGDIAMSPEPVNLKTLNVILPENSGDVRDPFSWFEEQTGAGDGKAVQPVKVDLSWLKRVYHPLARAFLDAAGNRFSPLEGERSLWYKTLAAWVNINLTPEDITDAVYYMQGQGLTIAGPQSVTKIARSRKGSNGSGNDPEPVKFVAGMEKRTNGHNNRTDTSA